MFDISYAEYLDKVRGGWFGKCLGGAAGAPFEGFKKLIKGEGFEATIDPSLPNDDLDLQLLWLEVLQRKGLWIGASDLADAWLEQCRYSMSEYGYFVKNYERGIAPPVSGRFNNSFFAGGNGCPIRSEIWGFIFPGNPSAAARYADMDGSLDHSGESVYIERFYAALESLAFFEQDIERLLAAAKAFLPPSSRAARCVDDIFVLHRLHPADPELAREKALRLYGHNDFTSSLANLAFVLIGLLYGEGDLRRTIDIALMCGYDTDCTCATAAAILCESRGFSRIDDSFKRLCGSDFVVGIDVKRSDNSIAFLAEEVCRIGVEAAAVMNRECRIGEVPESARREIRNRPAVGLRLSVEYAAAPAIGARDEAGFFLVAENGSGEDFCGSVRISDPPEGWSILAKEFSIVLGSGQARRIEDRLYTLPSLKVLRGTNLLSASLLDGEGRERARASFGVAGASVWNLAGPFFEALDKEDDVPGYPSPHGPGCNLPTLECMVNNAAFLDKAYLDESRLEEAILEGDHVVLNAYEDLLPIDESVTYAGQACFYLCQRVFSPEAREAWVVMGNNDGYRLWLNGELAHEKDENRLWTPYNNFTLVRLRKGENSVVLKLLRRTEELKFSIAFRKYGGKHWHQQRWITDMSSLL